MYVYYLLMIPFARLGYPALQCARGLVDITGEVRQLSGQQNVPGVCETDATLNGQLGGCPKHSWNS